MLVISKRKDLLKNSSKILLSFASHKKVKPLFSLQHACSTDALVKEIEDLSLSLSLSLNGME